MSVTVRAEQRPRTRGFLAGRQRLPPQRAGTDAAARRHRDLRKLVDRFLIEYPWMLRQHALIQHELRVARERARRTEKAGVARHTAKFGGAGVVDDAGDRMPVPQPRGCDAVLESSGRAEDHLLVESEAGVHLARHEGIERRARHAPHDHAQENRVEVGVHHARARRHERGRGEHHAERRRTVGRFAQWQRAAQTGRMRQQMANRDRGRA